MTATAQTICCLRRIAAGDDEVERCRLFGKVTPQSKKLKGALVSLGLSQLRVLVMYGQSRSVSGWAKDVLNPRLKLENGAGVSYRLLSRC